LKTRLKTIETPYSLVCWNCLVVSFWSHSITRETIYVQIQILNPKLNNIEHD
jgi:hypothetical protein